MRPTPSRGYNFENKLSERYNATEGWRAWRLGTSSAGLPDVLAVSDTHVHVHELKSTHKTSVQIPVHQLVMCLDLASAFKRYGGRVILSARFVRKAEYHCIWEKPKKLKQVSINRQGKVRGCDAESMSWDELMEATR